MLPTDEQINTAVPPAGTPNRAQTNAIIKAIRDEVATRLKLVDTVPATPTAAGNLGEVAIDAENEQGYICVAPNVWRSFGLTEW